MNTLSECGFYLLQMSSVKCPDSYIFPFFFVISPRSVSIILSCYQTRTDSHMNPHPASVLFGQKVQLCHFLTYYFWQPAFEICPLSSCQQSPSVLQTIDTQREHRRTTKILGENVWKTRSKMINA